MAVRIEFRGQPIDHTNGDRLVRIEGGKEAIPLAQAGAVALLLLGIQVQAVAEATGGRIPSEFSYVALNITEL